MASRETKQIVDLMLEKIYMQKEIDNLKSFINFQAERQDTELKLAKDIAYYKREIGGFLYAERHLYGISIDDSAIKELYYRKLANAQKRLDALMIAP